MLEGASRGLAPALAWAARGVRWLRTRLPALARRGRDAGPGPSPASRADPENAAFLEVVSETLRRIEAPGEPGDPPRRHSPAPDPPGANARWLRRLREPIRRHEDALLAALLLVGVLLMVAHWRSSASVHQPLRPRTGAAAARSADPVDRASPRPPEARAGAGGTGGGRPGAGR